MNPKNLATYNDKGSDKINEYGFFNNFKLLYDKKNTAGGEIYNNNSGQSIDDYRKKNFNIFAYDNDDERNGDDCTNVVIVDAAGSAFPDNDVDGKYHGGGYSEQLYESLDITNEPHKLGGKEERVFFNNELDYTFSNVANKTKIKNDKWKNVLRGIIHAIGPTGSDSEYDFSQKLKLVVQNLKKVLDEEFDKNENYSDDKQINLRIPLISSAQFSHPSYKNDKGPNEKYFYVYIRELEQVFGCYNIPYLKSVRIYF